MAPVRKRSSSSSLVVILQVLLCLAFCSPAKADSSGLTVGFYDESCPQAEAIIRSTMQSEFESDGGAAAAQMIRLHFHDCFVNGCDGSVLITGNEAEMAAPVNINLKGFSIADTIKSNVEAACPNTVSCADILAFAARDGINLTGGLAYQVPAGRRDGTVSNATEAQNNLPESTFNATQLIANFAAKNLSTDDLVILSGAHTVGVAHCVAFTNRLYNSTGVHVDPTLSAGYAILLEIACPFNAINNTTIVTMDIITPNVLDNKYYVGLTQTLGLFTSDQALLTETNLRDLVYNFTENQMLWELRFVASMLKMGKIQVKTGTDGEIRTNCSVINSNTSSSLRSNAGSLPYNGIATS